MIGAKMYFKKQTKEDLKKSTIYSRKAKIILIKPDKCLYNYKY